MGAIAIAVVVPLTAVVFVALLQPASARPAALAEPLPAPTITTTSMMWDGQMRYWRTFVPPAPVAAERPLPLLVLLHPAGGSVESFLTQTSMDRYATAYRFMTVTPQGAPDGTWNAGNCCATARDRATDDVGFVRTVIERTIASTPADPGQVYVAGASNGGMLAYTIACEMADSVQAVFSAGGAQTVDDCHPSRPVSVVEFHSLLDTVVPFAGGVDPKFAKLLTNFPSTAAVFASWSGMDRCASRTETAAGPGETLSLWYGCSDNTLLEVWLRTGGGHEWPARPAAPVDASVTIAKAIASGSLVRRPGQVSASPISVR